MEIGKRIKLIRECKGLKQEYVAAKLGITQQSYSSFEHKPGNKKTLQLLKIAEILEVDVCLFFAKDIPITDETIKMCFKL